MWGGERGNGFTYSKTNKSRFQKFWKINSKMPEHKNLSDHQNAFKEWKILEMTLKKGKTVDSKLSKFLRRSLMIFIIKVFGLLSSSCYFHNVSADMSFCLL